MYTFVRAEKLGILQKELVEKMGAEELANWMAFDMLQDEKYRDKIGAENILEGQEKNTAEQESALIKQMFLGLADGTYK